MDHAEIVAIGRALRVLGEHGDHLTSDITDEQLHDIRTDLKRALDMLDDAFTAPKRTTRCPKHPTGPIDKSAPDLCLLCETRRRTARRATYNSTPRDLETRRPTPCTPSRYGIRHDKPQAQERWLPESWNGNAWQLCGTPRRNCRDAELYLAAERGKPHAANAYRLVQAFTDYVVARAWGTPAQPSSSATGSEPLAGGNA